MLTPKLNQIKMLLAHESGLSSHQAELFQELDHLDGHQDFAAIVGQYMDRDRAARVELPPDRCPACGRPF